MPDTLVLTGERTLPGIPDENYWFRRHEAAYHALLPWVRGARLLEAGCGEGYGAALLLGAGAAGAVLALDYDAATSRHAAAAYPGVAVLRGDLQRLPLADGSVEVVVHLQTIEHLHDQPGFLAECARVLRPAGTIAVSTPNRLTFSPDGRAPRNPFHTRELSPAELAALLEPRFVVTRLLGVHHGRRLRRAERVHGSLVAGQLDAPVDGWSPALRTAVHQVRAADFAVREDSRRWPLERSLDLLAIGYRRP